MPGLGPSRRPHVLVDVRRREVVGEHAGLRITHAEVGAYLLELWGLPTPIVEAVAYHHNPSAALERTFDIPTAVSVANALVEDLTGKRPIRHVSHLHGSFTPIIESLLAFEGTQRSADLRPANRRGAGRGRQ